MGKATVEGHLRHRIGIADHYIQVGQCPQGGAVDQRTAALDTAQDGAFTCACNAGSPHATTQPPSWAEPPSQEVMTPPAPSMIGINACTS
ncbi:hypothetical protein WR25_04464 [Diploscapter pachys]|uniref:Uncharacterized protein n=1 Tax=Diploscapter pachys TaxID=2018661 RepID=A0A2A2M4P7_9BILA|nr:hypothetical protein WR25_04464 [Diploscapter pachys]